MQEKYFNTQRFISVFSPDGVRFEKEKVLDDRISRVYLDNEQAGTFCIPLKDYATHPLTVISYFLGLPNHPPQDKKQSFMNLVRNFIGWREGASTQRKIFNGIFMPFTILVNLLSMPFKAALNIARLITELLPQSVFFYLYKFKIRNTFQEAVHAAQKGRVGVAALKALVALMLSVALLIAGSFTGLGLATTSPMESFKKAHQVGFTFAQEWLNISDRKLNHMLGAIFSGVSLLATMSIYTVLFPFAVKLLIDPLLAYAATHFPPVIVNAGATVGNLLSPLLSAVGIVMTPIATTTLNILSLGFLSPTLIYTSLAMSSTAMSGLGALVGAAIDTFGIAAEPVVNKLQRQWYTKGYSSEVTSTKLHNVASDKGPSSSYATRLKNVVTPGKTSTTLEKEVTRGEKSLKNLTKEVSKQAKKAARGISHFASDVVDGVSSIASDVSDEANDLASKVSKELKL